MKIARLAGLMFAAILAISLAVASVASAAPEFKPAEGTFTGTSGVGTLKGGSETVVCAKDTNSGTISSATLAGNVLIHFLECTSSGATKSGCKVNSVGASEGLILTTTLHGILGTVLGNGGGVGLLLLPISGKRFVTLASNECTKETAVTGDIAGLVSPTGKSQTTGKLSFTTSNKKQLIKTIDLSSGGSVEPELVAYSATATEETEDSITFSKAIEVT